MKVISTKNSKAKNVQFFYYAFLSARIYPINENKMVALLNFWVVGYIIGDIKLISKNDAVLRRSKMESILFDKDHTHTARVCSSYKNEMVSWWHAMETME